MDVGWGGGYNLLVDLQTQQEEPAPRARALRDWSLITGRGGGGIKREGVACEVLPLRKGGGRKSFSHAEGGTQKVWGSFYTVA